MTRRHYPRVLFITPCAFNAVTGGGVTFSSLFRGWPKEALATITNDDIPVSTDVCGRYYHLTSQELSFIAPFHRIGRVGQAGSAGPVGPSGPACLAKRVARSVIGPASIPDRGRLSPGLSAFIREFRPDAVYTILGSPGYADLVLAVTEAFGLPLAVHFMDEGVTDPRLPGLFGPLRRCLYRRGLRRVMDRAGLLLAIGELMAEEYATRFGRSFAHFQHAVDLVEEIPSPKCGSPPGEAPRYVYVGAVLPYAQLDSLMDCRDAVARLNREGFPARLDLYVPLSSLPVPAERLGGHPMVALHDIPPDDEAFRRALAQADVLLLPANFDAGSRHFIRLSMPTKVPSFLAAGVPILVYGPADTAQAKYAAGHGWGLVATERGPDALARAMRALASDPRLRSRLRQAALETARLFHDARRVREGFREALSRLARTSQPRPVAPHETSAALATRLRFVEKALLPVAPRAILDVGCGTGEHLTGYLAGLFPTASVLGVDTDRASLERARRFLGDASNLSFTDELPRQGLFDAVIASEVLEHVDDPHAFLRLLRSRLRSGGVLVLTVPNGYGCSEFMAVLESLCLASGLLPRLRRLLGRDRGEPSCDTLAASHHVNFFTLCRLRRAFALSGLRETAASGRMFLHNFLCSKVIDASETLSRANAALGTCLPLPLVSDWMFVLRPLPGGVPEEAAPYRRNAYERAKGWLSRKGVEASCAKKKGGC